MSQENVETVRAFTRLFEAGDRNAWRDYFDLDVVWDTSASKDALWRASTTATRGSSDSSREWLEAWTDPGSRPASTSTPGGSVVITFRQSGIGRGSGVRTERDFYAVYDIRDSKVVRYRQYESRWEASIEAAGLRE